VKVVNASGELLVTNRVVNGDNVFYDHINGYFVRNEPLTVDGVLTDNWVQADAPCSFLNPIDGKRYARVPVFEAGVPTTDRWVEV